MVDHKRIASRLVTTTRTAVDKLLAVLLPQFKKAIQEVRRLKPRDWLVIVMGTLVAVYLAFYAAWTYATYTNYAKSASNRSFNGPAHLFSGIMPMCVPVLTLMICLACSRAKWKHCPAVSRLAMGGFSMLILTRHTWLWQMFGVMRAGSMDTFYYYVTHFLTILFTVTGYVLLFIAIFGSRAKPSENESSKRQARSSNMNAEAYENARACLSAATDKIQLSMKGHQPRQAIIVPNVTPAMTKDQKRELWGDMPR